jgi:hypothetical protein
MDLKLHIVHTVEEYTTIFNERQASGHRMVRQPEPPHWLGFTDLDTKERWLIQINDYKDSGDLNKVKEMEKASKAAKAEASDD